MGMWGKRAAVVFSLVLGLGLVCGWSAHQPVGYTGHSFGYIRSTVTGMDGLIDLPGGPSGVGKQGFLWKFYDRCTGKTYTPRDQGNVGSCVAVSWAAALDFSQAVRIAGIGDLYAPVYPADPMTLYGLARYEYAFETEGNRYAIRTPGAHVYWAGEAVYRFGCLAQKEYGEYDLTVYDAGRTRDFGSSGVPDDLEAYAKPHKIRGYAALATYEDVINALYRGFPVVVGSSVGFEGQPSRDENGFLYPKGSWSHAMVIIGFDDRSRHKGVLILNSWGSKWVTGPKRYDQPDGSFWVTPETVELMIKDGEMYAVVGFTGFRGPIDWSVLE